MRRFARFCVAAIVTAGLAACSSTRPSPASVEHRRGAGPGLSLSSGAACAPGSSYTVRSGDTLSQIAERCRIPTRDLADANGLQAPYMLRTGQTLTMPGGTDVHIVQRGENLYRIGLRYGYDYRDLASHNSIPPPYAIEVGQEIRLPAGGGVRTAAADTPPGPRSRPDTPATTTRSTTTTPPASTPPPQQPAVGSAPSFDWPLRGEIVARFGPREGGARNDGVNIRANEGDSVRAAAPGTVVYAGDELQGYGQLILLRHEGGWVTAYAHNSRLRVGEGDRVERGQIIAEAGSTGSVETAQLHFEIRRGVTPEDPMRHLPTS